MNILLDFLTAHGRYGAGEYQRRVVMSLLDRINNNGRNDIRLFALYDSNVSISFEDMREDTLGVTYGITYIDLQGISITAAIEKYHIDRFFIACGQRLGLYPGIRDVKTSVICVTHDLLYEEWYYNHMYEYWFFTRLSNHSVRLKGIRRWISDKMPIIPIIKFFWGTTVRHKYRDSLEYMNNITLMLKSNPHAKCIMVSEYSKATMMYNFGIPEEQIDVLYSPERIEVDIQPIENPSLEALVKSEKKYYLLVSADRDSKNAYKTIKAFERFAEIRKDVVLVAVGYSGTVPNCVVKLDFLSDSDLAIAMKNCYALVYPSFFEGFGYPPIEAMRYGKPVISSNATSIPEILGDSAVYFCPFYESAIFQALLRLNESNYSFYSERSLDQYEKVHERQNRDLEKLVDILLS